MFSTNTGYGAWRSGLSSPYCLILVKPENQRFSLNAAAGTILPDIYRFNTALKGDEL